MMEVEVSETVLHPTLRMFNKTWTRRPEAMWITMQPPAASASVPQITMNKLGAICAGCNRGSMIDAASVVHNGSQRVHAVSDLGLTYNGRSGQEGRFASLDSALVRLGSELTPLPMPSSKPDTNGGFAFNMWNNVWGTNYCMWYPYDHTEHRDRDLQFRLRMALKGDDATETISTTN